MVEMGRSMERHEDLEWHREARRWERAVPQPHVVDKKQERYYGNEDPSSSPDHPAQGPSTREISLHNFWL